MTQPLGKTKTERNKSIGSRVSMKELEIIQCWAKAKNLSVSDFIMLCIKRHINIINNKEILINSLENDLRQFLIITNPTLFEKKKRLLEFLKNI